MPIEEKRAILLLFVSFLMFFPSVFYLILGIGILPASYVVYSTLSLLSHTISASRVEGGMFIFIALAILQVAIYGFLYYWLSSRIISRISTSAGSVEKRYTVTIAIVAIMAALPFLLPVYMAFGEAEMGPVTIAGLFGRPL